MAGTTKEQLKEQIKEILKDADLSTLSAKKVRQQLEEKLSCDLTGRKKEVDALVMDYVNAQEENNEESEKSKSSEEESEPEPEPEEKKTKRTTAARKTPAKKAKVVKSTESSGEEENASASASDEEYSPKKGAPKPKNKAGRRKKGSDSDSDEDCEKPKPAKKAGGGRYTIQQRIEIINIHYKNGENVAETVRKTRAFLGRREAPCRTAIQKLVEKFKLSGQVSDVKNKTRARRSRTAENIAAVAESVEENPGLSIPRRSLELGIPQTSLHRILHKDLGLKPGTLEPRN